MFNLSNLMITISIATGVASSTPVCNTEKAPIITTKNENEVNDYTIQLEMANHTNQNLTDTFEENGLDLTYTDNESKTNWLASNAYVNINATTYITRTKQTYNGTKVLLQNEETLNNYENDNAKATRILTVLQLTPYNYNINNDLEIETRIQTTGWTDQYNNELTILNEYYIKNVYQTVQNNWSQYINKQIVKYTGRTIKDEIENVNNNFYYTKETTTIDIYEIEEVTDTTIINLTPQTTNYIIIEYIPVVEAEYYNYNLGTTTGWGNELVPCVFNDIDLYYITLSGTNIIPSGTYEVIDIPGLMWQILTMPFAFVSQAFNLTLFPGTPYQINISNLFLSIVAILAFVWLISTLLRMRG